MMATAPSVDDPADVSASPKPQPDTNARDVDSESPPVNGTSSHDEVENKHITSVEDQLNSADASASGGSDTEASRAGLKDGDKNHARTGSTVKKPATFKSVSVNKTFLASKPPAPSSTVKPTETKVGSSTPPPGAAALSSRPRLVAKSGTSARDSSPRLGGVNGGKPATTPDANAVWNKNRPTPAPDPKKLTDEELKKYGIHVASRLDEDEVQGQNKWADLDDDDDDWSPEAITWTDGTKTTLPHGEEPHPAAPSGVEAPAIPESQQQKTGSPAPPTTSAPLPKSGGLPSGRGLVLNKGAAAEKPTLVAKPPAPQQPAKSPWATLPPVENRVPTANEPPRSSGKESWAQKGMAPPGPPPREIAADDFSRSTWRDGSVHGNRELYNSQSGRYEPVPDRRGSFNQPRHPAVLQRAGGDQPEPSSAFQTSRTSQDGHFGRRRGSSNVSGGSGSFFQRQGKGSDGHMPPPEFAGGRRPSMAGSMENPLSPIAGHAQMANQGRYPQQPQQGYPPGPSPGQTYANMHQAGPPGQNMPPQAPAPQTMDDVEYQKKLMREKTELARKRRQEQEAAEEAARRERIQKKLDAMGPPPPKKNEKAESASPEETPKPTHIQQREQPDAASKGKQPSPKQHESSPTEARPQAARGPNRAHAPNDAGAPSSGPRRSSHSHEARPPTWSGSRPDRFVSWTPGSQPPRNVWGSPNNDRGLGNGTFDPELGRIPGTSVADGPSGKGTQPIAPPGVPREAGQGRQPQPPAPIGSRPPQYGQQDSDLASKWVNAVAESDKKIQASQVADRQERERQLAKRGLTLEDDQPTIKDTWRQVNVGNDGTRRAMPPTDPLARAPPSMDAPSPNAGVIGQAGQGPSQARTSRFFPSKDIRNDGSGAFRSRPQSPTAPPPTMDDHPAYEGDVTHPHVSLPKPGKPQPVVKLPPSVAAAQAQAQAQAPPNRRGQQLAWATPTPYKATGRGQVAHDQSRRGGDASQQNWQQKFNNLLGSSGKHSPPKAMGIDPASKSALDYHIPQDLATVSLPGGLRIPGPVFAALISKPMAEECFDEPEIGSLPHVKLPHQFPDAAWQPAEAPNKPLPRKFVVQASAMEPFFLHTETLSGAAAMRISLPGMMASKTVPAPFLSTRGNRGGRGKSGRGRGGHKNNANKEASSSHDNNSSPSSNGRGGGRGRGGFRGRGSDSWTRQSPAQSSQA